MQIIYIIIVICALHITAIISYATSQDISRYDLKCAVEWEKSEFVKAAERVSSSDMLRLRKAEIEWIKSGLSKHVPYIMRFYPFYDEIRAQAIATSCHSYILSEITKSSQNDLENNLKRFESNKISDIYIVIFANILEVEMNKQFNQDVGLTNASYLHCSYDNYDTARDVAFGLAEMFLDSGSGKTGAALGIGSSINRETIECRFRGDVKNFSTSYFYTSSISGNKFFNKDKTKPITNAEYTKGINISSHTIKSTLDFIVIRLDIKIGETIYQDIYAFQADRSTKQLQRIDSEYFLNSIATQYKYEK